MTEGEIEPYQLQGTPVIPAYLPRSGGTSSTHTPLYHSNVRTGAGLVGQPLETIDKALTILADNRETGGEMERGDSGSRLLRKVDLEFDEVEALKSSRAG